MSSVKQPKLTTKDFIMHPLLLDQQLALLYALRNLNFTIVPLSGSNALAPSASQIIGSPPNLIMPLPLMLDAPIADSSATAASVSTTLNLLLGAMRRRGDLPR